MPEVTDKFIMSYFIANYNQVKFVNPGLLRVLRRQLREHSLAMAAVEAITDKIIQVILFEAWMCTCLIKILSA